MRLGKSIAKLDHAGPADAELVSVPTSVARVKPPRPKRSDGISRYAFLIGGTLVLLIAAILLWQTWLVVAERGDAAHLDEVRDVEIRNLTDFVMQQRERVSKAVASDAVSAPLAQSLDAGRAEAAAALKQVLPDLVAVEFYRSDIGDVLGSNLAKFGYARSGMLIQADHLHGMAPLQTAGEGGVRTLVFALPVMRQRQVVAFAYISLPFQPLVALFSQPPLTSGRVELRQGNGAGDLLLSGIGSNDSGSTLATIGDSIPNSALRIGTSPPQPLIFLSRNLALLIPLCLLVLFIGATMFYARIVGWRAALDRMLRRKPLQFDELAHLHAPLTATAVAKSIAAKIEAREPPPPQPAVTAESDIYIDRTMFRAYDIRGIIGKTLNGDVARLLGRAIGSEALGRGLHGIAVGRDGRLSGPDLSMALIEGLRSTGIDVTDIGAAPTPLLYFATHQLEIGSGVMITGSHNPPDYNGFKIVLGGDTLSEDAIQKLYTRMVARDFATGQGALAVKDVAADYLDSVASDVQLQRKLKVVVDCGNGIAGMIAPQVLQAIGAQVEPLFCEVDGHFPNHHPDPSDLHNLRDLIMSVRQLKADVGLAFDGDGDRLGVVTASGEVIFPDRVLMLFAKDVLARNPGATIIYDVKCTGKLQPLILQNGGSPIMWRTGHSLIKAKMRETDAALAGEMSGHFFFKERWFGFDDAIYAAARLLEILAGDREQRPPQALFDELPKGVSTAELKIPLAEGEHYRFMERFAASAKFDGARLLTIDGVRADWPDGWGLVRASNTTPVLVLRFDADSPAALQRIQDIFRTQLLALDPKLPLPF